MGSTLNFYKSVFVLGLHLHPLLFCPNLIVRNHVTLQHGNRKSNNIMLKTGIIKTITSVWTYTVLHFQNHSLLSTILAKLYTNRFYQ